MCDTQTEEQSQQVLEALKSLVCELIEFDVPQVDTDDRFGPQSALGQAFNAVRSVDPEFMTQVKEIGV